MRHKAGGRAWLVAAMWLALAWLFPSPALAQDNALCAVAKIEILQEAALEREVFAARLVITNNFLDKALSALKVQVNVKDLQGNQAGSLFFVKVASLTGTNAVDGTGVVQANSSAEIGWFIVPAPGAGGLNPLGRRYAVSAVITGEAAGAPQRVETLEAFITVFPQPRLKIEYALPFEVFADEPLTAALEPVEPFPLGVRVRNVGGGTARGFKIDSAQPKIVENKQGLLVDFKLLATVVNGRSIPDTLLVPFGDISGGGVGQAAWLMAASLSGRFIEFSSTFTHGAELGGELTSLIESVTAYTLLKDVLVDVAGRDGVPDFLVNVSMPREAMKDVLDAGGQPAAELILESDQALPIPVRDVGARLAGRLGGGGSRLTLTLDAGTGPGLWAHAAVPFPFNGRAVLISVKRSDGKALSLGNVWVSKHFRTSDLRVLRHLHLLDLTSEALTYALEFEPRGLDAPPGAVTDLLAATGAEGGSLELSWTAPGEDGSEGAIVGGRYLLQVSEQPGAAFLPGSAQMSFATATAAGRYERRLAAGLVGNATFFARLWTQDAGGLISETSNAATAYARPHPPRDLAFTEVKFDRVGVSWQVGNNRLPIEYQVFLDTDMSRPFVAASPALDSFTREHAFAGLSPETFFFVLGLGRNPETGAESPFVVLASTLTPPAPELPPRSLAWSGAGGDGLWHNPANWEPAGVPGARDSATIELSAEVRIARSTVARFSALRLGASSGLGAPRLKVSGGLEGGSLRLHDRATLVSDTTETLRLVFLEARAGSRMTHTQAGEAFQSGLRLEVSGDLILAVGSRMDATGMGHAGIGEGAGKGCVGGGGAGHGGVGGFGGTFCGFGPGGFPYGDIAEPVLPGSVGGDDGSLRYAGGAGGGVVILRVGGMLSLDGEIAANGVEGVDPTGGGGRLTGGGSGGSINIRAGALKGRGRVQAHGGDGSPEPITPFTLTGGGARFRGGGGGGRIALRVSGSDESQLAVSAGGGRSGTGGGPGGFPTDGGAGTIFMQASGQENFNLFLLGQPLLPGHILGPTHITHALSVDTFTLAAAVISAPAAPQPLIVRSSLTLVSPFGVFVSTFSFPAEGITCFILPAHSTLSATVALSQQPHWNWLVNGGLAVPELSANDLVLAGNGSFGRLLVKRLLLLAHARLSAASLIISEPTALLAVPLHASLSADLLAIPEATSWSVDGSLSLGSALKTASFRLGPGGRLMSLAPLTAIDIQASGDITLASGSLVDAKGMGHPGRPEHGLGPGRGHLLGKGGGHGGLGGGAQSSGFGDINDDEQEPVFFGSSGGGFTRGSVESPIFEPGGAGGGMVVFKASGVLTIDGTIDASGQDIPHPDSPLEGGGSGGTINLRAAIVAGSGRLKAEGGRGAGGGGGGRIALRAAKEDSSELSVSVSSGAQDLDSGRRPTSGTVFRLPVTVISQDGVASLRSHVSSASLAVVSTAAALGPLSAALAQNLVLATPFYELSPSPLAFDPPATLSFAFDATGLDTTTLASYRFNGVVWDSGTIVNQALSFLPGNRLRIAGKLASASLYGVFYKQPDTLAPVTSLLIGQPSFQDPAGRLFAATQTLYGFMASDLALPGQTPSGVRLTEFRVDSDTGTFTIFSSSFALAPGSHRVDYRSVDKAGNVEPLKAGEVSVDASPPIILISSPLTGQVFIAGLSSLSIALAATDNFDPHPSLSPVLVQAQDRGTPRATRPGFVAVASGQVIDPFDLDDGLWRLELAAVDFVGNASSTATGDFEILHDVLPPRTSAVLGKPSFRVQGSSYIAGRTPISLETIDDRLAIGDGQGLGVSETLLAVDAAALSLYRGSFTIPAEGFHDVSFLSRDVAGNAESTKTLSLGVDNTAPLSSLASSGGRQYPGPEVHAFYASSATAFGFAAHDPLSGGLAAGLALTEFQDNAGPFQAFSLAFTLAEGVHALGYRSQDQVENLEVLRSTTILLDATPPRTLVSIGEPAFTAAEKTIYVTPQTPITFAAADPALAATRVPGSGVARIEVAIDSAPFAAYLSALTLPEGRHELLFRAVDNVGNVEPAQSLALRSDGTPPLSSLALSSPSHRLPDGVVLLSSRTRLALAAADPVVKDVASGVGEIFYRVLPGTAATLYHEPFNLLGPDGARTLEFFSRDNVLNAEPARAAGLLLDSTPPELALLSPPECDAGICRVLKGRFPVLGTVRDLHLRDFRLEYAPGKEASSGFVIIASAAVSLSSASLGEWETRDLSGFQTLRLSAEDLAENSASLAINVFVGDPGRLMVLGSHALFDMPEGVAVGADSRIYVADRNNDRVAVFSATGAFLTDYGGREDDDEDDDHDKKPSAGLRLNKPSAVALDAEGFLYLADTNHDRVLKLSATGHILLELAAGLNKPKGVAVDRKGLIYVADTNHHRVAKFGQDARLLLSFKLPPVTKHEHEEEEDEEEGSELGKPHGLAVDLAGLIHVADPKGRRVLSYDASGRLLRTLAIAGKPHGLALTPQGQCLLVSDRKGAILKFDGELRQNLAFGRHGKIKDKALALAGEILFNKPMGLALGPDNALYVADRNNNRVQKFSLPTGKPALIVASDAGGWEVARGVVEKEEGGRVERSDKAAAIIPPRALAEDVKIVVAPGGLERLAEGLKPAYAPVEFGPHGTRFKTPATVVLPYQEQLLASQGVSEESLRIHHWDPVKKEWEALESSVDKKSRTVSAKTEHFSLYQVLGAANSRASAEALAELLDPAFFPREVYVFPNPARAGARPTIHVEVGLADKVTIRVFDVSGREVHSAVLEGTPPAVAGRYAYEHAWDGHIASGVYLYVIEAKKAGFADIRKAGKFGVVR